MSDLVLGPRDTLHIRYILLDGRCNCLCSWADGEWKVEIFASEAHARQFAEEHHMEIVNHANDNST